MPSESGMTNEDRVMLIETHTMVREQSRQISKLFDSIEGNGSPGVKQRLTAVETKQNTCLLETHQPKRWPAVVSSLCALASVAIALVVILINKNEESEWEQHHQSSESSHHAH